VYIENQHGEPSGPSLEILSAARKVADRLGQRVVAVLLGFELKDRIHEPIKYGADEVLYVDDERLKSYACLPYTRMLHDMARWRRPYALLFVADEIGKDLAPRLAARLQTGLATDNIELEVGEFFYGPSKTTFSNLLVQIRPDFATRVAKIYTPRHRPQIATVRPGNFKALKPDPSRTGLTTTFTASFGPEDFKLVVEGIEDLPKTSVNLEGANCLISLGLGILRDGRGTSRNPRDAYNLAQDLAEAIAGRWGMKVEIGSSRGLIYAGLKELEGLITVERQIGQTGKTVSPEVYFALGISGAVQHRVGMQKSKKIVAVNIDPTAPILEISHYPIVGDLYEVVPRIIGEIRRH